MKLLFNNLLTGILKWKLNQYFKYWIFTSLLLIFSCFSTTKGQQLLKGNVPADIEKLSLKPIGRLDSKPILYSNFILYKGLYSS
jgi:hypothetical protein